ncbi:signal recognition particle protein [Candidatus Liberibacter americanus]|uniref:Signal recognition particle protein n=1 Tax=Candidatus Liberibacter americanus str. Sao Paulo TaxID=1261131 RepID=U6B3H6_9HYPH|nr:signal recognition particle protein [Candidatus Liberibacter americanus]AHA27614.1 Signal recognition particle GTPase [Candidatus Liberibacter americanus str. Sao Paulo]EMS36322.1 signal recognition particle protein [Candidatus Liberibacter americanus PW_SP]
MFDNLQERLGSIFKNITGKGILSESDISNTLREIRRVFLEADVSIEAVRILNKRVQEKAKGEKVLKSIKPGQMIIKIVHDELVEILGRENVDLEINAPSPIVIMMIGLQGSGKTTTTAKIANRLKNMHKKKVLMASLDVYRPAAQEQLRYLGEKNQINTLETIKEQSPIEIAKRALNSAKSGLYDVVILDTAGRNHIDEFLMREVDEIKYITKPHEILLVADALTGQDAVNIARNFNERLDISGIVLTRMDGDGRGGAALSMRAITGKPIKAMGIGEKIEDLEGFFPDRIANRILGMGDIVSLVEKAAHNLDKEKASAAAKKISKGKFDLDDLAEQLRQTQNIGGIGSLFKMMPMIKSFNKNVTMPGISDDMIKYYIAIISSMTKEERANPIIIKHSRKKRIAMGSGTDAAKINKILKLYRQMSDVMKSMKGQNERSLTNNMMENIRNKINLGKNGKLPYI